MKSMTNFRENMLMVFGQLFNRTSIISKYTTYLEFHKPALSLSYLLCSVSKTLFLMAGSTLRSAKLRIKSMTCSITNNAKLS